MVKDKIEILKDRLANIDNVLFGYIFGSYTTNEYTKKSDVDIALYLEDTSLDNKLYVNYELSKLLKLDVDLVVLNDIKNIYLMENIFKDGIVVKDSSSRIDFEITKQHDILDFKAFRELIDAA